MSIHQGSDYCNRYVNTSRQRSLFKLTNQLTQTERTSYTVIVQYQINKKTERDKHEHHNSVAMHKTYKEETVAFNYKEQALKL